MAGCLQLLHYSWRECWGGSLCLHGDWWICPGLGDYFTHARPDYRRDITPFVISHSRAPPLFTQLATHFGTYSLCLSLARSLTPPSSSIILSIFVSDALCLSQLIFYFSLFLSVYFTLSIYIFLLFSLALSNKIK
jgi:hypothetical protein